jgi:ribonuclease HI
MQRSNVNAHKLCNAFFFSVDFSFRKFLKPYGHMNCGLIYSCFSTFTAQYNRFSSTAASTGEPTNHLDAHAILKHVGRSWEKLMLDLVAYVDGGSLGNPGPAGVGVVIEGLGKDRITVGKWVGRQDNNVAEYLALLEALQQALELNARKLHVYSDSQVVVRQMVGQYNCRSPRLYSLHWLCRKLAHSLDFSISHIRREHNSEANGLAGAAARRGLV